MWQYNYGPELAHHGIKGMRWGVRRFQNKDGTLTAAGRKRASKAYKKEADKVTSELNRTAESRYINAYNKAADYMNRKGIDKFNAEQQKKHGKNYSERDGYEDDFMKAFDDALTSFYNQSLNDFYKSNKHYQESKRLVDKYGMTKWDDLAKANEDAVAEVRSIVEKQKKYD